MADKLRGELRHDEPMADYVSWRAGGKAEHFFAPVDREDLIAFVRGQPAGEPLLWIGFGSNLLVRDGGFHGTVILTRACLSGLRRLDDGAIYAEAGVSCARVARFCAEQGLVGAEFLAGIPGTLGGALAMNAGAFGGETWGIVAEVDTVDRQGEVRRRWPADYSIGYREVLGRAGEWFLAAVLRLPAGDGAQSRERIRTLLAKRNASQPVNLPSCGSVFRNPPGDYAARLIESCGLKGLRRGGACVSDKHANFIVNIGGATATDIEGLLEHVRSEVQARKGVRLRTEVCIVGEPLPNEEGRNG